MGDSRGKATTLDKLFRALADSTRLRLLNLMSEREICVCYFAEIIGAPQPKISRHLAYLRRAGLVATRKDGKWVHYRLSMPDDPHAASIVRSAMAALKADKQMQQDFERLEGACCEPNVVARQPSSARLARRRRAASVQSGFSLSGI